MKDMEKKNLQMEDTKIDIMPLLKEMLTKLWLMILVGLVTAGIVFGAAKLFIKPTYRCGFSAYVNNRHAQSEKNALSNQDLIAAQQLTKTLSYIIRSNTILSASLESIHSDLSYEEFNRMVSTEIRDETELISVYVVNRDPQTAYDLANAIAKTAPAYMAEIVEGSSMKIVDYPVYNVRRYKPNYSKFAMLGFAGGALLVAVIVLIRFFKNDVVRSEDEIEQRFGLPILGVLPDNSLSSRSKSGYYASEYGYGSQTEMKNGEGEKHE